MNIPEIPQKPKSQKPKAKKMKGLNHEKQPLINRKHFEFSHNRRNPKSKKQKPKKRNAETRNRYTIKVVKISVEVLATPPLEQVLSAFKICELILITEEI